MPLEKGDLSANVNIGGDVSNLRRSLDEGRSHLSDFASAARDSLGRIDGALSEIGNSLSSLQSVSSQLQTTLGFIGLGGAAVGLVAAYRQVAASAKEWADAGAQARRRGITVEFMSELRFAAEELGTKTSVVNSAMDKFRIKMAEVRKEGTQAAESLKGMNEPLFQALKGTPDQRAALFAAANAIKAAGSAADQARLAVELFGTENISMIHVLSQGEQGLKTWAKAARDAGNVLDTDTAESAMRLTHALDLLDRSPNWQSLEQKMIAFARNTAVILGGSAEAMNNKELTRAITVTETQLKQLEQALQDGAKAADDELGAVDQLKGSLRDLINTFGRDVLEKDQLIKYDPTAAVRARIEETKQRLAELRSLMEEREGRGERQETIDLWGADFETIGPPDFSKSESFLKDLQRRLLTSQQDFSALLEEERQADLTKLEAYLEAGTIRQEAAAKARFQIEERYNAEIRKLRDKEIDPFVKTISGTLDQAFGNWIEKGQLSWDVLAKQILADIIRIQFRMSVLQPLFGGGPEGGTGLVGDVLAGVFHAGGVVGGQAQARMVSPQVFSSAQKLHQGGLAGLRPDEVPAILRKREIVDPGDGSMFKKIFGDAGAGGAQNITFNVTTPNPESFRRSENQITAMLSRAMQRGQRNL